MSPEFSSGVTSKDTQWASSHFRARSGRWRWPVPIGEEGLHSPALLPPLRKTRRRCIFPLYPFRFRANRRLTKNTRTSRFRRALRPRVVSPRAQSGESPLPASYQAIVVKDDCGVPLAWRGGARVRALSFRVRGRGGNRTSPPASQRGSLCPRRRREARRMCFSGWIRAGTTRGRGRRGKPPKDIRPWLCSATGSRSSTAETNAGPTRARRDAQGL